MREKIMGKFSVSAAVVVALAATFAAAPASADRNWGPIVKDGQCWNHQVGYQGNSAGTFGYWGPCPQTASAVVVRHTRRHPVSR